jgi:hypothetical protein
MVLTHEIGTASLIRAYNCRFVLRFLANSSFRNDECLALSIDSANPDAADCYRIVQERTRFRLERDSQIVSAQRGTMNLAVAISQPHNAVALINKSGMSLEKRDLT